MSSSRLIHSLSNTLQLLSLLYQKKTKTKTKTFVYRYTVILPINKVAVCFKVNTASENIKFFWGQRERSFCPENRNLLSFTLKQNHSYPKQVILEANSLAPPRYNTNSYCTREQRHVSKLICSLFLTDSGDACIFFPIDAQASGVNCGSMSLSNTFCIGWQGIRSLV